MNPTYSRTRLATPMLAIMPARVEDARKADRAFGDVFAALGDEPAIPLAVPIPVLRQRIARDPKLAAAVAAALEKMDAEAAEPSAAGSLRHVLGEDGIALLRRSIEGSNLVLWPVAFEVRDFLGRAFGTAVYRLYDLDSGDLVYQTTATRNLNRTGELGGWYVTYLLAAAARSSYQKEFLDAR